MPTIHKRSQAADARLPHEMTFAEFEAQATVEELTNHGRKWNVALADRYAAFSDADTPSDALADVHRAAVNNALYFNTPETANFGITSTLPPKAVLDEYPELARQYASALPQRIHPPAFIDTNGILRNWDTADTMPVGWQGIAQYNSTLFLIGNEDSERSFTALRATTYPAALKEVDALSRPIDPALDPRRIAQMAIGANARLQREAKARAIAHAANAERAAKISDRQATWQQYSGGKWPDFNAGHVLRIGDEPFIAVPANGKQNAAVYVVFDIRDPSDRVTQLRRHEVQGWLFTAGNRDSELSIDVETLIANKIPFINRVSREGYAGRQQLSLEGVPMEPKITSIDFMNTQIIDRGLGNVVVTSDLDKMVRDENYPKEVRWALSTMMSLMGTHYALGVPVNDPRYTRGMNEVFNSIMDRARSAIRHEMRNDQGMGL